MGNAAQDGGIRRSSVISRFNITATADVGNNPASSRPCLYAFFPRFLVPLSQSYTCVRRQHAHNTVLALGEYEYDCSSVAYLQISVYIRSLVDRDTRWGSWLRHCSTNRKVAGSIPDGIIGILH
jgi:hypothetical protein